MTTSALRGRIVTADLDLPDGVVEIVGESIGYVGAASDWRGPEPLTVALITPGLIDIHCHGGGGYSVDAEPAKVADHHVARGTTTMLGSLVSGEESYLIAGIATIAEASHPALVGAHLEGPWLDHDHRGAHDPATLTDPDPDLARRLVAAGPVRMVTLAPERTGAADVARLLDESGVVVALGHTGASSTVFRSALGALRVGHVTHLFNGMPPMHHRRPGPVGAALSALADKAITVELIADGVHLDDDTVRMVFSVNAAGVVLVSDAMSAAGMPDGAYELGTLMVDVRDGKAWTTGENPSLAGSTAHLSDIVRHCIADAGIPAQQVIAAATATPARVVDLHDRGDLARGLRADLVVYDEQWRPQRTMLGGTWVA